MLFWLWLPVKSVIQWPMWVRGAYTIYNSNRKKWRKLTGINAQQLSPPTTHRMSTLVNIRFVFVSSACEIFVCANTLCTQFHCQLKINIISVVDKWTYRRKRHVHDEDRRWVIEVPLESIYNSLLPNGETKKNNWNGMFKVCLTVNGRRSLERIFTVDAAVYVHVQRGTWARWF